MKTVKPRLRKKTMVVLAVFLAILLAGISSGEPRQVLSYAVQICLSCIGIG